MAHPLCPVQIVYYHTEGRQQARLGPLVSRFRDLGGLHRGGLVAGPWGDISPDFAKLIQIFAESRAENMNRARGWEAGKDLVGRLTGEIRRSICVSIIRASQLCLLERLSQLGPGAPAAAARRQKTLHLEFQRDKEREAFHQVWLSKRSSRVGRAFI